jgi:hypothetical protein
MPVKMTVVDIDTIDGLLSTHPILAYRGEKAAENVGHEIAHIIHAVFAQSEYDTVLAYVQKELMELMNGKDD